MCCFLFVFWVHRDWYVLENFYMIRRLLQYCWNWVVSPHLLVKETIFLQSGFHHWSVITVVVADEAGRAKKKSGATIWQFDRRKILRERKRPLEKWRNFSLSLSTDAMNKCMKWGGQSSGSGMGTRVAVVVHGGEQRHKYGLARQLMWPNLSWCGSSPAENKWLFSGAAQWDVKIGGKLDKPTRLRFLVFVRVNQKTYKY